MKKPVTRIMLLLCLLAVMTLACSIADPPVKSPGSGLSRVNVSPSSGNGPFVAYIDYFWRSGDTNFTISCSYPDADGNYISAVIPLQHNATSVAINFVVKKPGTYNFSCSDIGATVDQKNVGMVAVFTVAGSSLPAEPEAGLPPQTDPVSSTVPGGPQMSTPGQFTSGRMWFEFARATSRGPNFQLMQACLPGLSIPDTATWHYGNTYLKVAPDGTLTGECSASTIYTDGQQQVTSKLIQGRWAEGGQITFRLETSRVIKDNKGTAYVDLVFIGAGKFISSTTATGTANWTATCQGSAVCSYTKDDGDIPWIIDFYP
jgi:hypothetical protein